MQSHLFPPRTRCNFCPALATTCKKRGGWAGADTAKQRSSCLGIDNEVDATTKNPPPPSPGDTINTAHVASSPLRLPPLFLISIVWDSQHTETPARGRGSDSSPRTRGQRHQSAEAAARSHPSHLHPPPPLLPSAYLLSNSHSPSHLSSPAPTIANNAHEPAAPPRTPGAAGRGDPTEGCLPPPPKARRRGSARPHCSPHQVPAPPRPSQRPTAPGVPAAPSKTNVQGSTVASSIAAGWARGNRS